jgi:hypothetical protein
MSREKWFNPEDKSPCVIRPELQDKTALSLPPNLLVVFSQNLLKNFVKPNVLYQDSALLQFFGGESNIYRSNSNRDLVAIEGTIKRSNRSKRDPNSSFKGSQTRFCTRPLRCCG